MVGDEWWGGVDCAFSAVEILHAWIRERERERGLDLEGLLRFYAKRERVFFFFLLSGRESPLKLLTS